MSNPSHEADWTRLFRIAYSLIKQANAPTDMVEWTFGGGTAMMIQVGHRESRDVDIFLSDPQFLAFLNPKVREFAFEIEPHGYSGDGSRFIKIAFDIGEIDFIVAQALTDAPTTLQLVEDVPTFVETVPEIIAKKIFYRGRNIKPRDIFDIAVAAQSDPDRTVTCLRAYRPKVEETIARLEQLNPDFVRRANEALAVRDPFRALVPDSLPRALELLRAV